jgi:hypothetical protein
MYLVLEPMLAKTTYLEPLKPALYPPLELEE